MRVAVGKDERRNDVRYNASIEEEVRNMSRRCVRRDSRIKFRVTIRSYFDKLVWTCGFWKWFKNIQSYKIERSRRVDELKRAFVSIDISIMGVVAALVYCTVIVARHMEPEKLASECVIHSGFFGMTCHWR